jgi:glycerol-3-phosphate acyltransferase PlsY
VTWTALIVLSYLLGSISWSYLLVRLQRGEDVRQLGSHNAGATNVAHVQGCRSGLLVLALDMGKGAAPPAAALGLHAPGPVIGSAAVAAILGHIFPIFLGFRGGKGVATAAGAMFVLAPLAAALGLVAFVLVTASTRYVALGSITAVAVFPLFLHVCGRLGWSATAPLWLLVSAAAIATMIVFKHRDNLSRIRGGTESKLGQSRRREEVA